MDEPDLVGEKKLNQNAASQKERQKEFPLGAKNQTSAHWAGTTNRRV